MARAKRPWFRVYVEMPRDKKLRRLTPAQRWLWVVIMSCARESPIPGFLMLTERSPLMWEEVADAAGMKLKEVMAVVPTMDALGLIAFDTDLGAWSLPAWKERQFESDDVTVRTGKHRSREQVRNVP